MYTPNSKIKVLLVDDSPIALAVFNKMLAANPEIEVVATASNGKQALERIPEYQPDVICSDLNMPVMDGYAFTQAAMQQHPRPILVLSTEVGADNSANVFRVIDAGAVDVLPKPRGGLMAMTASFDDMSNELIEKIKTLARQRVNSRQGRSNTTAKDIDPIKSASVSNAKATQMVCVGASVGGPEAIRNLLSQLSPDFPAAILCVLNVMDSFLEQLVNWLAPKCSLPVRIARDGEVPRNGVVYFPSTEKKFTFNAKGQFSFESAFTARERTASINFAFESMAQHFGDRSVGVFLSGMADDGLKGLQAIQKTNGVTIVQKKLNGERTDAYDQMVAANAAEYVVNRDQISKILTDIVSSNV